MLQRQAHDPLPTYHRERRSWIALCREIYQEFSEDRIPAVAGGVTFFFLIALFPALASIVSIYGLFADRGSIIDQLNLLSGFLPGGAVSVLAADIRRLTAQKPATLNVTFGIGFVLALWSTSGGIKALIDALNIAFERKDTRSFIRLTVNAIVLALGAVVTGSLAIYAGVEWQAVTKRLPPNNEIHMLVTISVWPLAFLLCSTAFSLIYRYGADRARTPWRWLTWGSSCASIAWLLGTMLFGWYVQNYGSYDRTYGDLGAVVGFLTWIWLSMVILLAGAEITNVVDERDVPEDRM